MGRKTIIAVAALALAAVASSAFAVDKATALLKDADGRDVGKVTLIAVPSGVLLAVDLTDMPPGDHGFHIHGIGKCVAPYFKSAGGHFNPEEDQHGILNEAGPHAGDMPNIHVPASGKLKVEVLNQSVNLGMGLLAGNGTAIVIHEGADDYISNPAGDAGPRIACGVITE